MAVSKYRARTAPTANLRVFLNGELVQIQLSLDSVINLLKDVGVPVVVGANDSAGAGFRTLKIPNA